MHVIRCVDVDKVIWRLGILTADPPRTRKYLVNNSAVPHFQISPACLDQPCRSAPQCHVNIPAYPQFLQQPRLAPHVKKISRARKYLHIFVQIRTFKSAPNVYISPADPPRRNTSILLQISSFYSSPVASALLITDPPRIFTFI